jgi:hypothetical protein
VQHAWAGTAGEMTIHHGHGRALGPPIPLNAARDFGLRWIRPSWHARLPVARRVSSWAARYHSPSQAYFSTASRNCPADRAK